MRDFFDDALINVLVDRPKRDVLPSPVDLLALLVFTPSVGVLMKGKPTLSSTSSRRPVSIHPKGVRIGSAKLPSLSIRVGWCLAGFL
jgi:hypothetical protein